MLFLKIQSYHNTLPLDLVQDFKIKNNLEINTNKRCEFSAIEYIQATNIIFMNIQSMLHIATHNFAMISSCFKEHSNRMSAVVFLSVVLDALSKAVQCSHQWCVTQLLNIHNRHTCMGLCYTNSRVERINHKIITISEFLGVRPLQYLYFQFSACFMMLYRLDSASHKQKYNKFNTAMRSPLDLT